MKKLYEYSLYLCVFFITSPAIAGVVEHETIQNSKKSVISYQGTANKTFYKTMAYDIENQMLIDGKNYKKEIKEVNSGVSVNSNYINADSGSTVVVIQNNIGNTVAVGK